MTSATLRPPSPVSFAQTFADGWTSPEHPWGPKSEAIIRHNLRRTDLPEPVTRVRVRMDDGSAVFFRAPRSPHPRSEVKG